MRKKSLSMVFAFASLISFPIGTVAEPVIIPLQTNYVDPLDEEDNPNRTPVLFPTVSIDGNVLLFACPCNCAIDVVQDGIVIWSTDVDDDTNVILPSWLSGEYELQLIPEDCNYYFTGMISL